KRICPSILLFDQCSYFRNWIIDELLATLSCYVKIVDECDGLEPANPVYTICVLLQNNPCLAKCSSNWYIQTRKYLPEVHGNVLYHIEETQKKQKALYDRHIKATPDIDIGDRKGLYYVYEKLPNGVYKLREMTGSVLATAINKKLKTKMASQHFHRRTNLLVFKVYTDLHTLNLFSVEPTPCPFVHERNINEKTSIAYNYIVQAVNIGDRIESLVHAFYLGALISTALSRQIIKIKRIVL
ncbi:10776_t:CDS:2, partial [Gigaspora rosea]